MDPLTEWRSFKELICKGATELSWCISVLQSTYQASATNPWKSVRAPASVWLASKQHTVSVNISRKSTRRWVTSCHAMAAWNVSAKKLTWTRWTHTNGRHHQQNFAFWLSEWLCLVLFVYLFVSSKATDCSSCNDILLAWLRESHEVLSFRLVWLHARWLQVCYILHRLVVNYTHHAPQTARIDLTGHCILRQLLLSNVGWSYW